jgi:dTDP-glucose pyrophosphorylase
MVVTGHPGMLGDEGQYVRGIILAAGDGGRLYPLTAEIPKPLLPVAGRPLVSYTIEALVAAEVDDLVIVVGHRGDDIRAALGDGSGFAASIRYVENPRYRGGNGHSLWCAREYLAHGAIVVIRGRETNHGSRLTSASNNPGSPVIRPRSPSIAPAESRRSAKCSPTTRLSTRGSTT